MEYQAFCCRRGSCMLADKLPKRDCDSVAKMHCGQCRISTGRLIVCTGRQWAKGTRDVTSVQKVFAFGPRIIVKVEFGSYKRKFHSGLHNSEACRFRNNKQCFNSLTYGLWSIIISLHCNRDVVVAGTEVHVRVLSESRIRGPLLCKLGQTLDCLIGDRVKIQELIAVKFNVILAFSRHVPLAEGDKAKQVFTWGDSMHMTRQDGVCNEQPSCFHKWISCLCCGELTLDIIQTATKMFGWIWLHQPHWQGTNHEDLYCKKKNVLQMLNGKVFYKLVIEFGWSNCKGKFYQIFITYCLFSSYSAFCLSFYINKNKNSHCLLTVMNNTPTQRLTSTAV